MITEQCKWKFTKKKMKVSGLRSTVVKFLDSIFTHTCHRKQKTELSLNFFLKKMQIFSYFDPYRTCPAKKQGRAASFLPSVLWQRPKSLVEGMNMNVNGVSERQRKDAYFKLQGQVCLSLTLNHMTFNRT
jgi:hypothetical protein